MGRRILGCKKRTNCETKDDGNGFGGWGGYMEAKKAKLMDQFHTAEIEKVSDIFQGVAIHVNGMTKPPADTLKNLMSAHGGEYHMYQVSKTTHIIASNLPNVKVKQLGTIPIIKPSWITESIAMGKLLDYRRYLLYTNQSSTQPRLDFPVIEKPVLSEASSSNVNESELITNSVDVGKIESGTVVVFSDKGPGDQRGRGPTKTAADPKFLEEFYSNSRLHLISTLGAEFKQLVAQLREKSDGNFPGRENLIKTKGKETNHIISDSVIMHIDMDCFFVSVGLRNHPELRGKPVAITHARRGQLSYNADREANREIEFELFKTRLEVEKTSRVDKLDANASMSEIASCSYEARKCGIKNGMFLGQAVKLCPKLKTLPYDFEGYKEVSNTLYKTIASYTLDIEAMSCDEMYVDVTNILKETGLTVDEWATHIRNEIMTVTRCPCSTGFGANRLQARLATRKAKPSGQYYLQADDVEVYMSEIPLADLPGVGMATLAKLRNLGLTTCGDVQVASLKVLQSELGHKAGETLKEQARGVDKKPLNFDHERKSVSAEVNYGIRFKTVEECYNFLQSLSNEVYTRLSDIGMRARSLTLKLLVRAPDAPVETAKYLGCGVCDSLTKTTSNLLINNPEVIFREVKILYDKLNPPFIDLRGIGIQLTKLEKNAPLNKALTNFLNQAPTKQAEVGDYNNKKVGTVDKPNNNETNFENHDTAKVPNKGKGVANGKRGRPKGIRSSISSRTAQKVGDNSTSLSKYFGKNKTTLQSQKVQSQKIVPLKEEIDLTVLNELPEDLRNEIIREYQLEHKIKESNSTVAKPDEHNDFGIIGENSLKGTPKSDITENVKEITKKNPFSGLVWEQIKPIIKKWVQSSETPSDVDVEMIAEHFKQLAIDREIEILKTIFNFLHRIFSDLNCHWHKAYFGIVNIVQQGMVARYGGTLMVKRRFICCEM